jgi:hypothetical protein
MPRIAALVFLGACATSSGTQTLGDGRRVVYDPQPPHCFQRCDTTGAADACEWICEPRAEVKRILPSCREECATAASPAACIEYCEHPPRFICGNALRSQTSHTTRTVVTTLTVIGFSIVGALAADMAIDR